ncbi:MAG TPA: nucleotidyltransferase domain-containing protein [Capsulimonadaceae bacterium]|nr:nucleotidyltransferase domain-containing protein [Capsulimonadaceae bacterium]
MTPNEGVDADGYIVTEVSREKVSARYEALLEDATSLLKAQFSDTLHSVYLYGSVAMGKAVDGKSDLDLLAVFKKQVDEAEQLVVSDIAAGLSEKWRDLVREVGIEAASVFEVLGPENAVGWGCFLKHLCVSLDGDDLSRQFGKFRPGREVAWGLNGDLAERLEQIEQSLRETEDSEVTSKLCASASRRIVRVGFGLVMVENAFWTTDLERSCELFCKRYRGQEAGMRRALEWTEAPSSSKMQILGFLKGEFVSWLLSEFHRKVGFRGA